MKKKKTNNIRVGKYYKIKWREHENIICRTLEKYKETQEGKKTSGYWCKTNYFNYKCVIHNRRNKCNKCYHNKHRNYFCINICNIGQKISKLEAIMKGL